jgi:Cysteine rich repeat
VTRPPADAAQGSARVIRCLQQQRERLSEGCKATLFDQEVRMAEDIDFKYPMKQACAAEITRFCPNKAHGHAETIRCARSSEGRQALPQIKRQIASSVPHTGGRRSCGV